MTSRKTTGRLAGLLYLGFGFVSAFCLVYLPSVFYVSGDAAATAHNIVSHEMLFRVGIAAGPIYAVGFLFVPLTLYSLMKNVDGKLAALMVTLFALSVPISFLNELNHVAALRLLSGADYLSGFTKPQLEALVMVFLNLWRHGNVLAQIFWGLWLIPFGLLVLKSGFLPKFIGVLLIVACFGYLAASFTEILFPARAHLMSMISAATGAAGELPVILWLVTTGGRGLPVGAAA